jgi:hypothetical protein
MLQLMSVLAPILGDVLNKVIPDSEKMIDKWSNK